MSSKNFMINALNYTGRRYQLSRPSAVLARTNPDLKWCIICNQSVEKRSWGAHVGGVQHRLNAKKDAKLKEFALGLWEEHRGAPIFEESKIEKAIRDGSVAETIAKQNERSDDFEAKMLSIERNRRAQMLTVEADEDESSSTAAIGKNDRKDAERRRENELFERNYQRYLSQRGEGGEIRGEDNAPQRRNNRTSDGFSSRSNDKYNDNYGYNTYHSGRGERSTNTPSASSSPNSWKVSSGNGKENQTLVNHAALRRQMMMEGIVIEEEEDERRGGRRSAGAVRREGNSARSTTSMRRGRSSGRR